MSDKALLTSDAQEHALLALLRAIASRNRSMTSQLLLAHGARPSDKDSAGKSVKDSINADWIHGLLRQT